jgi:hypothetical protein
MIKKLIIVYFILLNSILFAKPIVNIDFTAFGENDFQFTLNPKRKHIKFISAKLTLDINTSLKEFEIDKIEIYNPKVEKILHYKPSYCCDRLSIFIDIPYNDDKIQQSYTYIKNGWYGYDYYKQDINLKSLSKSKWYDSASLFFSSDSKLIVYYKNEKSIHTVTYDIKFIESFEKVVKEFEQEYKSSVRWNIFWVTLAYILFIIILYKILKAVIPKIYHKTKQSVNELQKKKQENKRKKIEEDEIIRANIKKTINDEQKNEIEGLQEIINNALAKGDTETAQALLKILNNKKEIS